MVVEESIGAEFEDIGDGDVEEKGEDGGKEG